MPRLEDQLLADPHRRFGTFGGVFTPTLLTILGVIMYLRQGWVIGNAGILGLPFTHNRLSTFGILLCSFTACSSRTRFCVR